MTIPLPQKFVKKRVLIVDDDDRSRRELECCLAEAGYETVTAGDGLTALDILKTTPIDLILAEVHLPRLNGYHLFQTLTESQTPYRSIPFIFMSSHARGSDARYAKSLGADDFLSKPIPPEELLASVRGRLLAFARLHQSLGPPLTPYEKTVLIIGENRRLQIDYLQHRSWLDDKELALTPTEQFLLETLAVHANRIVSGCRLVEFTHGIQSADQSEIGSLIRVAIRNTRMKLGEKLGKQSIQNVRGRGYLLAGKVCAQTPATLYSD